MKESVEDNLPLHDGEPSEGHRDFEIYDVAERR